MSLFNIPDQSLLNLSLLDQEIFRHPLVAAFIGGFGAILFIGLIRRIRRFVTIGVIGICCTVGFLVWQLSR